MDPTNCQVAERGKLNIFREKVGTSLIRFPYHYFWSLIKSGGEPGKYMAHLLLLRLTYLEILCWLLQDTGEEGRKAARTRRLQHRSKHLLPLILPLILYRLCPGYYTTQTVGCLFFIGFQPGGAFLSFCITLQLTPDAGRTLLSVWNW